MPSHLTNHCRPEVVALHDRLATEGPLCLTELTREESLASGDLLFRGLADIVRGDYLALTMAAAEAYRIAPR